MKTKIVLIKEITITCICVAIEIGIYTQSKLKLIYKCIVQMAVSLIRWKEPPYHKDPKE